MKLFTKRDKRSNLDKEIDSVFDKLKTLSPDSEEYTKMTSNLSKLLDAKNKEKDKKVPWETILAVGGNLLGIVLVLNHEQLSVITTKALGFIIRPRI